MGRLNQPAKPPPRRKPQPILHIELGLDKPTLQALRDIFAPLQLAGKLDALEKRLASANNGLDAVVKANPDPDPQD